ncbi:MAG: Rossmann-like and DUF2520 domain-containing protein [Bacteroidota bacterium]
MGNQPMNDPESIRVIMIGAGNVGFHLGKKLYDAGISISQVYSRAASKAERLANICGCDFTHQLTAISTEGNLYLLAVPDQVIGDVAKKLAAIIPPSKLVVHTSGATPSTVLKTHFQHYGIFYPLQSFSLGRAVDFNQIPICIDANAEQHRIFLEKIAQRISRNVHTINDRERAILHVAAVFVNNFSNHLFTIGEKITTKENLPFDILKPLIQETVNKIQNISPSEMQTGPAQRGDQITIQQHLNYLEKQFPELVDLYTQMTQRINSNFQFKR